MDSNSVFRGTSIGPTIVAAVAAVVIGLAQIAGLVALLQRDGTPLREAVVCADPPFDASRVCMRILQTRRIAAS